MPCFNRFIKVGRFLLLYAPPLEEGSIFLRKFFLRPLFLIPSNTRFVSERSNARIAPIPRPEKKKYFSLLVSYHSTCRGGHLQRVTWALLRRDCTRIYTSVLRPGHYLYEPRNFIGLEQVCEGRRKEKKRNPPHYLRNLFFLYSGGYWAIRWCNIVFFQLEFKSEKESLSAIVGKGGRLRKKGLPSAAR